MAYYYSPFRKKYKKNIKKEKSNMCVFCNLNNIKKQLVYDKKEKAVENEHYVWAVNWFPKFEGHTMLIPKRHLINLQDETKKEVLARQELQKIAQAALLKLYPKSGIEIFGQFGPGSASSIPHIHWHIVPALPNDFLRSFEKLGHFYTIDKEKKYIEIKPKKIKYSRKKLQKALSQHL